MMTMRVESNGNTYPFALESCIHELFEQHAARAPETLAVECAGRGVTYRELNEQANRLAHHLRSLGVAPDRRVAICVQRSVDMIVAVLATWKAGGCYVPLDPGYPVERIAYMLKDSAPVMLLTHDQVPLGVRTHLRTSLAGQGPTVDLAADVSSWAQQSPMDLPRATLGLEPGHLAYVIYTSGSTGQPKGVMVEHRGVCNLAAAQVLAFPVPADSRIAQCASFSFDASVYELVMALCNGASLHLPAPGMVPAGAALTRMLADSRISHATLTPGALASLDEHASLPALHTLVVAGEACPEVLVERWARGRRFINAYGPTETTVWATWHPCSADDDGNPPIGLPIANTEVYVLDEDRRPVASGDIGELYVGGAGVARGYLNRPELTAERFMENPLATTSGSRMYRTGDLARCRADGRLEFLGRNDFQVKIRGLRIELGEIESQLLHHPAVRSAVVIVREDRVGDKRLVAYVTPRDSVPEDGGKRLVRDQLTAWSAVSSNAYSTSPTRGEAGFDHVGWISSYTRQPLGDAEMRDWLHHTVRRITALKPRRVLEIGCGTGMILFNVAPRCERYVGTDLSGQTVAQLQRLVERDERLKDTTALVHTQAADFAEVPQHEYDTIVLNSVVQYFPSLQYLQEVIESALGTMAEHGHVFIGDVRNYKLLDAFHLSVQLHQTADDLPLEQLASQVAYRVRSEQELAIDPAWFFALQQRNPRIKRVHVVPRQDQHQTEMSAFRYDVVLTIGSEIAAVQPTARIDGRDSELDASRIQLLVEAAASPVVVLTSITNRRVAAYAAALRQLQAHPDLRVAELRDQVAADGTRGMTCFEVAEWCAEHGYALEVSWFPSDDDGAYHAVIAKQDAAVMVDWGALVQPSVVDGEPSRYANDPLRNKQLATLPGQLRPHLLGKLPEYMVPAAYVVLPALPLTANGKLDRNALPAPQGDAFAQGIYEAPHGEIEQTLAAIWTELLQVPRVGRHDHFFALGGHSLLLVQLMARMRENQLDVDIRTLFAQPTLSGLAQAVSRADQAGVADDGVPPDGIAAGETAITPAMLPLVTLDDEQLERIVGAVPGGAANVQDIYPLAPLQEGILFHHLLQSKGDPYLLSWTLAFDSRERLERFVQALQQVVDRHDAFRTAVLWDGLPEPVQVVWRRAELEVETLAFAEADDADVAAQLRAHVDARRYRLDVRRAPMMRGFTAFDAGQQCWLLQLVQHHLTIDHVTGELVMQEMALIQAGRISELPAPVPFRNFVAQMRMGVSAQEHEAYFRQMLGDVDEPTAPFGMLDVQSDGGDIEEAQRLLEPQLSRRIRQQARALGVTAASLFHWAWAQVLARTTGRDDVVFGTVLFGRMHGGKGADRAMGLFINTLPVRIRLGALGVQDSIVQTHETLAQLIRHEHAPLAIAQRCSALPAGAPLFSALLNYYYTAAKLDGELSPGWGEGVDVVSFDERTNYPFSLSVDDLGQDFRLVAQIAQPIEAERICDYMHRALEGLVEALEQAPRSPAWRIDIVGEAERRQMLVEWNDTRSAVPQTRCIHELFEEQVARTPDAAAVIQGGRVTSYRALNEAANRLAHQLVARGVRPGQAVAVMLERSTDLVMAEIAILKCGGSYVPLDHSAPDARLGFMLEDCGAQLVLTRTGRRLVEVAGLERVELDALDVRAASPENLGLALDCETPAYVMYTSGSTGLPKGVVTPHRAIGRVAVNNRYAAFDACDRVAFASNPAFDASTLEVWGALLGGGCVVVIDADELLDPARLAGALRQQQVTAMWLTASLFNQLTVAIPEALAELRYLLCGGERNDPAAFARVLRHGGPRHLIHGYGPTETTTFATTCEITAVADGTKNLPIGRPIADTTIYVLDRRGQLVPRGVTGEIYIGGAGVAHGYLNRPELTEERFLADPFAGEPGARMYRTGDLGRWLADGTVEFLGRNDHQVKIRGFRIELGEIEAQLARQPGVREAVVVAREDSPGDQRLVAYVVGTAGEPAPEAAALRQALLRELPEYMVPAAYVVLPALPLTANGKLDRKALPAPEGDAFAQRAYEAPHGETEQALAAIWTELLQVPRVGRHDHFFALGGHSLLLVQLMARMRENQLDVDIRTLFAQPTLSGLAQAVSRADQAGVAGVAVPPNGIAAGETAITPAMLPLVTLNDEQLERIVGAVPGGAANVQDIYPLAPLQEGILFHHLLQSKGDPYLLSWTLAFDSRERLERFVQALQQVVDRHDVFRTAVLWDGLPEPVQVVWRRAELEVETLAFADADVAAQLRAHVDARRYRLDVRRAPMMRGFTAFDARQQRWLLQLVQHHLVIDHVTFELLVQEMALIQAGRISELPAPVPFRNFVAQMRMGVSAQEHEAYFRQMLGDVDEPTAPFGMLDVQSDGGDIEEAQRLLEPQLSQRIRQQARALGVTAASLFHWAWAQVLARTTGRDDVVFGTVLFGRMHGGKGADRAMGLFINTLPVRIRLGALGIQDSIVQTHETLAQLIRHEHAPLAIAQRCNALPAGVPLFSALLNYRYNALVDPTESSGWADGVDVVSARERTNYPFSLSVDDLGQDFRLVAQIAQPIEAERICDYMHRALEGLVEALEQAPRSPAWRIDILGEAERRQVLVEWNDTRSAVPQTRCIHELFEEQVARTPDAAAVIQGGRVTSYRALNEAANRLAHQLVARGVRPGQAVAVMLERSTDLVMAEIAILKCGGSYVPLDHSAPDARLGFILEDCAARLVLTRSGRHLVEVAGLERVELDALDVPAASPENLGLALDCETPAYVMYTSGSTGRPKGVVTPHRAIGRVAVNNRYAAFDARDRVAFAANPAFDASTMEVWGPLLGGGCAVVIDADELLDPARLARALRQQQVTTLFVTTALFNQLAVAIPEALAELRYLLCGGERNDPAAFARVLRHGGPRHLIHCYGPTETTTFATTCEITAVADGTKNLPIGRPIADTTIYVLDRRGQLIPRGVAGEIYIGGAGVARGYLNRPELTEERFLRDPFASEPGARMYRTGDLGRWLADGTVEFLGRNDHQVKIRGFRIELGEIETQLVRQPGVREAVVVAREDSPGDQRLVAYVVGTAGEPAPEAAALRQALLRELPEYMVPAAYVVLPGLPLTANGKLDRKALPAPEGDAFAQRAYEPPRGEIEQALAAIWAELLQVERVGRHDHFFELGGHSLLAVRLMARMRENQLDVDIRTLFAQPTLSGLAQAVSRADQAGVAGGRGAAQWHCCGRNRDHARDVAAGDAR